MRARRLRSGRRRRSPPLPPVSERPRRGRPNPPRGLSQVKLRELVVPRGLPAPLHQRRQPDRQLEEEHERDDLEGERDRVDRREQGGEHEQDHERDPAVLTQPARGENAQPHERQHEDRQQERDSAAEQAKSAVARATKKSATRSKWGATAGARNAQICQSSTGRTSPIATIRLTITEVEKGSVTPSVTSSLSSGRGPVSHRMTSSWK